MFSWRQVDRHRLAFLDSKKTSSQRLLALREFLHQDDEIAIETRHSFLAENIGEAYAVLQDAFAKLYTELLRKAAKRKAPSDSQRTELFDNVICVLEIMLTWNPVIFHKRWQYQSVNQMVAKLLAPGNCLRLRKAGIRVLVRWMVALRGEATACVLERFNTAMGILVEDDIKSPTVTCEQNFEPEMPMLPETSQEARDDAIPQLVDHFFETITACVERKTKRTTGDDQQPDGLKSPAPKDGERSSAAGGSDTGDRKVSGQPPQLQTQQQQDASPSTGRRGSAGEKDKPTMGELFGPRSVSDMELLSGDTTKFFFLLRLFTHQYMTRLYRQHCDEMGVEAMVLIGDGSAAGSANPSTAAESRSSNGFEVPDSLVIEGVTDVPLQATPRTVLRLVHDVVVRWYLRWLVEPHHVGIREGLLRSRVQMSLVQHLFSVTLSGSCGSATAPASGARSTSDGGATSAAKGAAAAAAAAPPPQSPHRTKPAQPNTAASTSAASPNNAAKQQGDVPLTGSDGADDQCMDLASKILMLYRLWLSHKAVLPKGSTLSVASSHSGVAALLPRHSSESFLSSDPPQPPQSRPDSAPNSASPSGRVSPVSSSHSVKPASGRSSLGNPSQPADADANFVAVNSAALLAAAAASKPHDFKELYNQSIQKPTASSTDNVLWAPDKAALRAIYKAICDSTALAFTFLNTDAPPDPAITLCRDALCVFQLLSLRLVHPDVVDAHLSTHALQLLLAASEETLGTLNLSTRSSLPAMAAQSLASPFFETVIVFALRMTLTSVIDVFECWEKIREVLHRYTNNAELIVEWRRVVSIVTLHIAQTLSPEPLPPDIRAQLDACSAVTTANTHDSEGSPRETPTTRRRRHHPHLIRHRHHEAVETPSPRGRVGRLFARTPETSNAASSSATASLDPLSLSFDETALAYEVLSAEFRDLRAVLQASPATMRTVWPCLLACLGNVNDIDTPRNHARVLATLRVVVHAVRPAFIKDHSAVWVPPFVNWFVEAAKRNERFAEGRYLAYKTMCEILLVNQHAQPPQNILIQFYSLLIRGLRFGDRDIVYEILSQCPSLFSRGFAGSTVLILDFISAVRTVLGHGIYPPQVHNAALGISGCKFFRGTPKTEAISLLCSMVCFPAVFTDLAVPALHQFSALAPEPSFAPSLSASILETPKADKPSQGRPRVSSLSAGTVPHETAAPVTYSPMERRSASTTNLHDDLPHTPMRRHTAVSVKDLISPSPGFLSAPTSPIKLGSLEFHQTPSRSTPARQESEDDNTSVGLPTPEPDSAHAGSHVEFADVQGEMAVALRAILIEETDTFCRCTALKGLCTFVLSNVKTPTPGHAVAQNLESMLAMLRFSDLEVAATAINCLWACASEFAHIESMAPGHVGRVIVVLTRALMFWLPDASQVTAYPCLALPVLWCLRDWVLFVIHNNKFRDEVDGCVRVLERIASSSSGIVADSGIERACSATRAPQEYGNDLACYMSNEIEAGLLQESSHSGMPTHSPSLSRRERRDARKHPMRFRPPEVIQEVPEGEAEMQAPLATTSVPNSTFAEVRASVQTVLQHIRSVLGRSTALPWPTRVDSDVLETSHLGAETTYNSIMDEPSIQLFALNEATIVSLIELPSSMRIIIRDCTGKFAWDFVGMTGSSATSGSPTEKLQMASLREDDSGTDEAVPDEESDSDAGSHLTDDEMEHRAFQGPPTSDTEDDGHVVARPASSRSSEADLAGGPGSPSSSVGIESQEPAFPQFDFSSSTNPLKDVLHYISKTSSLPKTEQKLKLTLPASLEAATKQPVQPALSATSGGSGGGSTQQFELRKHSLVFEPTQSSKDLSHLSHCRRMLSQLGLNSWGGPGTLCPLPKTERLMRELKNLDDRGAVREQHKIGVIYRGHGQDDKVDILCNPLGSPAFEEFVQGLGWPASMNDHRGYRGNLKASQYSASVLPYYATPSLEVLFHVSTGIVPTGIPIPAPTDQQKELYKARWVHIGNDDVHIVWNDALDDYTTQLLPTQFGEVTMVITPLAQPGLVRINLLLKKSLPPIGPLYNGAVVDEAALPLLIRVTAVNAGRVLRTGMEHPFQTRQTYLSKISAMCADPTFEEFTTTLIAPRTVEPPSLLQSLRFRDRTPAAATVADSPKSRSLDEEVASTFAGAEAPTALSEGSAAEPVAHTDTDSSAQPSPPTIRPQRLSNMSGASNASSVSITFEDADRLSVASSLVASGSVDNLHLVSPSSPETQRSQSTEPGIPTRSSTPRIDLV